MVKDQILADQLRQAQKSDGLFASNERYQEQTGPLSVYSVVISLNLLGSAKV